MKRAVVLSGGGSKGAYEIGVWAALKKLRINYDIVTGTSVGALNAAIMTQNTFYKGLKLWHNLDAKMIFNKEIGDYNTKEGKKEIVKNYAKGILNGGMDVNGLENTIDECVDLKKLYKSKIDMGIITFNYRTKKPTIVKKNKVKPEKLKSYLLASASCYPAFKMKEIDNELYMDGGIYDNLPINLAIEMGATEVIAVDLREVGFKQKVKNENIPITYIAPRNDIGSFLIFESNLSRRAIRFGYNDAMKTFNVLEGNLFTFKHNHLHKNFNKYYDLYKQTIMDILNDNKFIFQIMKITSLKRILNDGNLDVIEKDFNKMIESLGLNLKLDESRIYKINNYNKILKSEFLDIKENLNVEKLIKEKHIKDLLSNKLTIKYIYDELNNNISKKKLYNLILLFPSEFLQAVYLKTIIDK